MVALLMTPILALVLALSVDGCGSNTHHAVISSRAEQTAIAKARRATKFAPYAEIFPRRIGTKACAVHAGIPGNVFRGTCSTSVPAENAQRSTVVFAQDFGEQGTYTWTVRVPAHGPAILTKASGRGLVQLIP